jgi:hypothetical protein
MTCHTSACTEGRTHLDEHLVVSDHRLVDVVELQNVR